MEDTPIEEDKRKPGGHMAKMAELYRNEKLGEGRHVEKGRAHVGKS